VLVLANDPMLAALIGGLVELAHLKAAFAQPGETPEDALARVKPVAAILVDGDHADAEDDLIVARARKRGIAFLMFGTAAIARKRRAWAERQDVPVFELPAQVSVLHDELLRLREPEQKQRTSTRRAPPHTERDQDGTLIFDDGKGTRWSVYDRRSEDRRSKNSVDRRFVNENGAVLHCDVSEDEAASVSVADLARQLARATPLPLPPD
jgi:hypothetical protein